eukprot:11727709-Ditylum_brightwellii.AAC.1
MNTSILQQKNLSPSPFTRVFAGAVKKGLVNKMKTVQLSSLPLLLFGYALIILATADPSSLVAVGHRTTSNLSRAYEEAARNRVTPRASRFYFGRNPYSIRRQRNTLYTTSGSRRSASIDFFDDDDENRKNEDAPNDDDEDEYDSEWGDSHASRNNRSSKMNKKKVRNTSQRQSSQKRTSSSILGDFRVWQPSAISQRSSLTQRLVWTNVAIYGLQVVFPSITRWGAKRSDLILSRRELYRLISPVFLHGGVVHLAMNSFSLNNIGPEVERCFGQGRFLG